MSVKRYSPTASALRSSRFFSLPPPLPRPPEFIPSNTFISNAQSASATLPHPVQQAIATPASARSRGDWGLKRSLPRRSTQRSTDPPIFRINAVDTREHITDFDTASDLTVTREKFLELGIPVSIIEQRPGRAKPVAASPFEPASDNTDARAPIRDPRNGQPITRWKFEGPWLAGLSEQKFLDYVENELYGRKEEFLAFLRHHEAQRQEQSRKFNLSTDEGRGAQRAANNTSDVGSPTATMSDSDFAAYLRKLRSSFFYGATLPDLISRFLDIPVLAAIEQTDVRKTGPQRIPARSSMDDIREHHSKTSSTNRTVATGPPSTHPSGGLSYLRVDSLLPTHPLFGPISRHQPAVARVLGREDTPTKRPGFLGVAGFAVPEDDETKGGRQIVADVRRQTMDAARDNDIMKKQDSGARRIGVSIKGGNRAWVEPVGASVDESGRVKLKLTNPDDGLVDSVTEDLGGAAMVSGSLEPNRGEQELIAQRTAFNMRNLTDSNVGRATGFLAKSQAGAYGIGKSAQPSGTRSESQDDRRQRPQSGGTMKDFFNVLNTVGKENVKDWGGGRQQ